MIEDKKIDSEEIENFLLKNNDFILKIVPVIIKNEELLQKALTEKSNQCLRNFDKTDWPCGPWKDEIDYEEWIDSDTGYLCVIGRNTSPSGTFCGYVRIPKLHPLYGKKIIESINIKVHGGITYSGNTAVLLLGLEKGWWIGFDCGHYGDISPLMPLVNIDNDATYKDFNYAKKECEILAKKLKKYEEIKKYNKI